MVKGKSQQLPQVVLTSLKSSGVMDTQSWLRGTGKVISEGQSAPRQAARSSTSQAQPFQGATVPDLAHIVLSVSKLTSY